MTGRVKDVANSCLLCCIRMGCWYYTSRRNPASVWMSTSHSQLCAVLVWLSGFETINQQVFDRFHNTSISWPCIVLICQVICYITYIHTYIHTNLCPVSRVDPPGPLNWSPCLCLYLYPILVVVLVITISSTVVFLPPPQPHHQHPQVHSRVGGYHNMMEERGSPKHCRFCQPAKIEATDLEKVVEGTLGFWVKCAKLGENFMGLFLFKNPQPLEFGG